VRVYLNSAVVREQVVTLSEWLYPAAQQLADGLAGTFRIDVAQMSDRFGPGLHRRIELAV